MAAPLTGYTTTIADESDSLALAHALAKAIEAAEANQTTAMAALLIVGFIVGRQGWPVVEENLRPFIRDVSTYMSSYELPVKSIEQKLDAAKVGDKIPEPPAALVN